LLGFNAYWETVVRGFQYRFYPSPEQKVMLAKTFGCARFVYNWALNLRSIAWKERQESINYGATSAALTELKRQPEVEWLNEVSCVPIQQSLRHLQTAFVNFWQSGAGYPGFKKRSGHQSAEFTRSGFQWKNGKLSLARIGKLKIRWSRHFQCEPTTVHVSRTPAGRYYISFRVDEALPAMPEAAGEIGIDLGLKTFAAFNDGTGHHAPRPLRRKMAQLKKAQKALSRKRKGSSNRNKARIKVAKIHEKISDIRRDGLQKLTTDLVRKNHTIVIEDLNVRGMMANHCLAGAVADSAWGEFARELEYKCGWYGRVFIRINRWYPSSRTCSTPDCGFVNHTLTLDDREWTCPRCRTTHDRDTNASRNILAVGLAERQNARGDAVTPRRDRRGRQGNHLRSENRSVRCA
jgi:putative transposase